MSDIIQTSRRQLRFHILRYNPQDENSTPHMQTFELEEAHGLTLFVALNEIREHLDASLCFDFVCRAGICGSCAMLVNGRPALACRTLTQSLGEDITLAPLPVFKLIADLSVDTGRWMRDLSERLQTWVHNEEKGKTHIYHKVCYSVPSEFLKILFGFHRTMHGYGHGKIQDSQKLSRNNLYRAID